MLSLKITFFLLEYHNQEVHITLQHLHNFLQMFSHSFSPKVFLIFPPPTPHTLTFVSVVWQQDENDVGLYR